MTSMPLSVWLASAMLCMIPCDTSRCRRGVFPIGLPVFRSRIWSRASYFGHDDPDDAARVGNS